jgi:hypothetical protein
MLNPQDHCEELDMSTTKGAARPPVKPWRDAGKHLPPWLRDFHDQKRFFRWFQPFVTNYAKRADAPDLNWVQVHCFIIDVFLWHMARHGYTLQKSWSRRDFTELEAEVAAYDAASRQAQASALRGMLGRGES